MIRLNNDQVLNPAEVRLLVKAALAGKSSLNAVTERRTVEKALEKIASIYRDVTGVVLDGFAQPGEESK